MMSASTLALVAAVLCPTEVVLVNVDRAQVIRRTGLPAEGAGVFAAPDGRVLVPLRAEDATFTVTESGHSERWRGRLFPLFFTEVDRLYAVLSDSVVALSYPERVLFARVPVPGLGGPLCAACSRDGRIVAVIPRPPGNRELILVEALTGAAVSRVDVGRAISVVAVAPDGGFSLVGGDDGELTIVTLADAQRPAPLACPGAIQALALDAEGRDAIVALAHGSAGAALVVKVEPERKKPLVERRRIPTPWPVRAVAWAGDYLLVAGGDAILVVAKRGKGPPRALPLPGAADVAVLPERPVSVAPAWSDQPKP
jgi:hypothetical protein